MACFYCSKPIYNNQPLIYCLECEWKHTVRNEALNTVFFYVEEEIALKKKLRDIRKNKRDAEKRYNQLWREMGF